VGHRSFALRGYCQTIEEFKGVMLQIANIKERARRPAENFLRQHSQEAYEQPAVLRLRRRTPRKAFGFPALSLS
jgi:hypothetical protein